MTTTFVRRPAKSPAPASTGGFWSTRAYRHPDGATRRFAGGHLHISAETLVFEPFLVERWFRGRSLHLRWSDVSAVRCDPVRGVWAGIHAYSGQVHVFTTRSRVVRLSLEAWPTLETLRRAIEPSTATDRQATRLDAVHPVTGHLGWRHDGLVFTPYGRGTSLLERQPWPAVKRLHVVPGVAQRAGVQRWGTVVRVQTETDERIYALHEPPEWSAPWLDALLAAAGS